jgi:hypothetical protein
MLGSRSRQSWFLYQFQGRLGYPWGILFMRGGWIETAGRLGYIWHIACKVNNYLRKIPSRPQRNLCVLCGEVLFFYSGKLPSTCLT